MLLSCTLLSLVASSPAGDPGQSIETPGSYEPGTVSIETAEGEREYPYRLLRPDVPEGVTLPLLVFMHGAGERGNNNTSQLGHFPGRWLRSPHLNRHDAFILAVQCPKGTAWTDWNWKRSTPDDDPPLTDAMRAVMAAVDDTIAQNPIDERRLYLTGLSMGGYGSWELGARQPGRWAAVVPICGGGHPEFVDGLVGTPVWAWHGTADNVVPEQRSRVLVDALRSAGGEVTYTTLPGVGHNSWNKAYGPDGAIDWMFTQRLEPWPPHHVIDETVAAVALNRCRATWSDSASWTSRADRIRSHLEVTLDIDLDANRPPVPVRVSSVRDLDGYRVSNLQVETAPGLFIAANLYEPIGRNGPFPAVLCPHGHAHANGDDPEGRFQHDYQALCATFARMGVVALTWDMVGWAETTYLPHRVADTTTLQTWNSVRMLDWLSARGNIDEERIGMTGSSGGGTQTFLATALDERITASAPVVMVSAHWFGGCHCESGLAIHEADGLRTSNVEFAALAAPRPQLLVSCGGDWTSNTPRVEFPYLRDVYEAMGEPSACRNVHLPDEQHDYGPSKRQATYDFLANHFGISDSIMRDPRGRVDETGFDILSRDQLVAFDDVHPLPPQHVKDHAAALESIRSITATPTKPVPPSSKQP